MFFDENKIKEYINYIVNSKEIDLKIRDLQIELEEENNITGIEINEKISKTNKVNSLVEDTFDRKNKIERNIKLLEIKKKRAKLLIESGFFTIQEQKYINIKYIDKKQYHTNKEIASTLEIGTQALRNLQRRLEKKLGQRI